MKGSEIDDPGHLIGLKPRRFPNWAARQQPIKICPLCSYTYTYTISYIYIFLKKVVEKFDVFAKSQMNVFQKLHINPGPVAR